MIGRLVGLALSRARRKSLKEKGDASRMIRAFLPIILITTLFAQGCGGFVRYMRDQAEEQTVVENGAFKLRLSKLESAPGFMTSSRYLVESLNNDSGWIEAYRWSQDDPWHLSDIDINTVTPMVGYFFRMTEYGVTVDAGKTWKIFNVNYSMRKDGSDKITALFDHGVPRVTVNEDGTGSIYAQAYYEKSGSKQEIYSTSDFGQSWQLIESAKSILK